MYSVNALMANITDNCPDNVQNRSYSIQLKDFIAILTDQSHVCPEYCRFSKSNKSKQLKFVRNCTKYSSDPRILAAVSKKLIYNFKISIYKSNEGNQSSCIQTLISLYKCNKNLDEFDYVLF